jgi:hypothetical protein
MGFDRVQVVEIARVCEFVEVQDAGGFLDDPLQDEIRAYKASAAGDENQVFHAGVPPRTSGSMHRF